VVSALYPGGQYREARVLPAIHDGATSSRLLNLLAYDHTPFLVLHTLLHDVFISSLQQKSWYHDSDVLFVRCWYGFLFISAF
jgi:hypothetical protein